MSAPAIDWRKLQGVFDRLAVPGEGPATGGGRDWLVRDLAEERAAIMEFCGEWSRGEAERQAYAAQGLPPPAR